MHPPQPDGLFIENQYHNRECDCDEHGNDRNENGVRADINPADPSQGAIDKSQECPSAGVPALRRRRLGRLRRGRNRNGIGHDDPFN